MKGIILAGGRGSRLNPVTIGISKQLIPIFDKPMIYYPLSNLMLAGIRDILVITTTEDLSNYQRLLRDGSQFGIKITYKVQEEPKGLPEAFIIGDSFIGNDSVCLALGDNIFWGQNFSSIIKDAIDQNNGTTLFGYSVKDPERFGVAEIDDDNNVISIEEKPKLPKSNYAITGLYIYDNTVIENAKNLKPSARGELEISDLNNIYLKEKRLKIKKLGRGFAWIDTGTNEALSRASTFVETIEKSQGFKISCPEEIALNNEWINTNELKETIRSMGESDYTNYLKSLIV